MKILLFDKTPQQSAKLLTALSEDGHQLTLSKDEVAATNALASHGFDLMLLSAHGADETAIQLLRTVRNQPVTQNLFTLLVANDAAEEYLSRAYDAGLDGDLRTPYNLALIKARLKSAARVVQRLSDEASTEPADSSETAPLEQSAKSAGWRNAEKNLKDAAGKFLSLGVELGDTPAVDSTIDHACKIILSNVQDQLEIRVAVGSDTKSATALATHLFGEVSPELTADMLSEFANIAMGNLKTVLSAENIAFTGGLPESLALEHCLRPAEMFTQQKSFVLKIMESSIVVHLGLRSKKNLFLIPAALIEGMIAAKDIFNARGMLLVNRGTRMSENMIDKLKTFLPAKSQVEVMAP
jgi:DNA-binding response OmpR family regulator